MITAILYGALHPYHTLCSGIGFQSGKGYSVGTNEVTRERVVPIQDDHAILAEVESNQVSWRKHSISVPGSSDCVLNDGKAPRIVCLKDGVIVRSIHARGESIINDVTGDKLIAIWRKPDRQSIAYQQPTGRCRARCRSRGTRSRCRGWRGDARN